MVSRKIKGGTAEGPIIRVAPAADTPLLSVRVGGNSGGQLNLPGIGSPPLRVVSSQSDWQAERAQILHEMMELRKRAIAKGMKLLSLEEIQERRSARRRTISSD